MNEGVLACGHVRMHAACVKIQPVSNQHCTYFAFSQVKFLPDGTRVPMEESALCQLKYFGLVSGVPMEAMHTFYILACRHFLDFIKINLNKGFVNDEVTGVRRRRLDILNSRIKIVGKLCPFEFDRKVTTTDHQNCWKATSYRQFFLYLAYPLLEDLVDGEILKLLRYFQYFFYLIGGADPNPVPEPDLQLAQSIIEFWVAKFIRDTKGVGSKPSIHFLLHVVDDCRNNMCHFDVLSAFRYENALRPVKNDIKSGNFKLEQIRNRMLERSKYCFNRDVDGRISRNRNGKPSMGWSADAIDNVAGFAREVVLQEKKKYQRLVLPDVQVETNKLHESFVLIKDPLRVGSNHSVAIVHVKEIKRRALDHALIIVGHMFMRAKSLFDTPEESNKQHVYVFSHEHEDPATFLVSSVVAKLYVIPRFAELGITRATDELVGDNFNKVEHWVGVALRHSISDKATLY
jgi:hypothetical protein